jgi:hypothetical protein
MILHMYLICVLLSEVIFILPEAYKVLPWYYEFWIDYHSGLGLA